MTLFEWLFPLAPWWGWLLPLSIVLAIVIVVVVRRRDRAKRTAEQDTLV